MSGYDDDISTYGAERYFTDEDRVYYEDYIDAQYRDYTPNSEPEQLSLVDAAIKAIKMLTVDPVGAKTISTGIQGAVVDFIVDLMRGDAASISRRLDDIDNLTANLLMYLAARGVAKEALTGLQIGYINPKNGEFIPDYTLMYQFSYVLKNQLSDTVWSGYSDKYTGRTYDMDSGVFKSADGVEYVLRTWSYAKGGNTHDAPQSGGWMKSKFGNYYIRKNLY